MKVYFDNADLSGQNTNGPHSFARRLAIELSLMGHTIADHDDYDIALVIIENTSRLDITKPFVQRLDGIWFNPNDFEKKNKKIRDCYYHADAIVFQTKFDKQMTTRWFGKHKKSRVILNGIELKNEHVVSDAALRIREEYEKIFVCSASWRPVKRLDENIRLYRRLREEHFKNSCLIILGGGSIKFERDCVRDNIFYAGQQSQDVCLQTFAIADYMLHLAFVDHCPNVVLESLSQGTPVICTDSGGTKEILGHDIFGNDKNGIVIKDVDYNFDLIDYTIPPTIPDQDVFIPEKIPVETSHIDMRKCAESYVSLFEEVLSFKSFFGNFE